MRKLCLVLTLAGLIGCNKKETASEAAPAAAESKGPKNELVIPLDQQATAMIQTETVAIGREPEMLHAKGRIAIDDNRTWRQGVRTTGSVTKVFVGLGDLVHQGQILARYHADEVRDSRAMLRTAEAEKDRAEEAVAHAKRNLDRAKRLLELKAGSAQQVDQAQHDVNAAEAAVKKADIEIDRLKDLLEDDLRVPTAPTPNRADETEDEVPIIAPANGYVLEKNVTPGRTVEPDSITFVIGDLSTVWMLASVKQDDLAKLRVGQSAYVTIGQNPRQMGKLTNLGQQFDAATRMMQVRIELANPKGILRPEMLADAEIPIGAAKPILTVSSDALQQVNGQDAVFVRIASDRFAVRPVTTGETSGGKTAILQGLESGDQVVVRGSFVLKSQLLRASLEE